MFKNINLHVEAIEAALTNAGEGNTRLLRIRLRLYSISKELADERQACSKQLSLRQKIFSCATSLYELAARAHATS